MSASNFSRRQVIQAGAATLGAASVGPLLRLSLGSSMF